MKQPNSIESPGLHHEINKKLNDLQKRKICSSRNGGNANTKSYKKMMHQIKSHIQMLQNQHKIINVMMPGMAKEDLLDIIDRIMLLQKSLIELSKDIANYRRLQMLCIFFHCSISIVFNAYNLVVFLLKLANQTGDVPVSLFMLLFFFGYHITSSMTDIIVSVVAYTSVFKNIRKTATKMDELNMYIFDTVLNARISQLTAYVFNNLKTFTLYGLYNIDGSLLTSVISGTTTYIIILIQYSGDGEICKTVAHANETHRHQV